MLLYLIPTIRAVLSYSELIKPISICMKLSFRVVHRLNAARLATLRQGFLLKIGVSKWRLASGS